MAVPLPRRALGEWPRARSSPFRPLWVQPAARRDEASGKPRPRRTDRQNGLYSEFAGSTLVSERTVDESVGKHPRACIQRGPDCLGHVIGPGSGEQQCFGLWAPTIFGAAEKQLADAFRSFTSAGLAS